MSPITIRSSGPSDAAALERLAALDSRPVPAGEVLVAEIGGELVAAHGVDGTVADPFRPTADVVDLLRLRAAAIAAPRHTPRRVHRPSPHLA